MSRSMQHRQVRAEPITNRYHKMTFGKYNGWMLADVLDINSAYLIWAHNNVPFFELGYELLEEAEGGITTDPT